MSKSTNKKTRCPKNYLLKDKEVAGLAKVSVSYVKKIRTSDVNTISPKAQRVLAIDELAKQSKTILIQEIERIVNF